MARVLSTCSIALAMCLVLPASLSRADCTSFQDHLEDEVSILANGGEIHGDVTLEPGVYGNAVCFPPPEGNPPSPINYVRYLGERFTVEGGAISFLFRRTISTEQGGILQIGELSTANSLGVFYNTVADDVYVFFEMRNNAGAYQQVSAKCDLLEYTEILIAWESDDDGLSHRMRLFVDGELAGERVLSGLFLHESAWRDIGKSGVDPWYGAARGCMDELRFWCGTPIPAVSQVGLVFLLVMLIAVGALVARRHSRQAVA